MTATNTYKENADKCHAPDVDFEYAEDDVTGAELDPEEGKKARKDEIGYVRERNIYTKVPIKECWDKTGKKPIAVRWINVNKGDAKNPNL